MDGMMDKLIRDKSTAENKEYWEFVESVHTKKGYMSTDAKDYKVVISGFTSLKVAKEFYSWFVGQGEQDTEVWFECRSDENETIPTGIYTNMKVKPEIIGNEFHFTIRELGR